MERLIQSLDELEDFFCAAPLIAEQLRRAIQRILFLLGSFGLQVTGVILAQEHPPLALAVVAMLTVGLLFKSVVGPIRIPSTAG
ncbi:MAG: hypothetical protein ACE5OQ_11000 [Woeseia sp.]